MKLFNTRTHQVDEFAPLEGNVARIYSCGPTVYNHAHIGNLSAYIFADILRRAVNLAGHETKHVMNFTDVDDKTIRDSRIEYPELEPREALTKLTHHYEKVFLDEMAQIGNDTDTIIFTRATEAMSDIKELINKLIDAKIAYISYDGIYFSIKEYQKNRIYGQLSRIETAFAQSRIDNDEYDKDEARDFALWKRQRGNEPKWSLEISPPDNSQDSTNKYRFDDHPMTKKIKDTLDSGETADISGRPGWHIECSAMSVKNLGQPFDIHTGGVDLIFPHHENEIAQSTAGDQPELYANFFVHNEHLLVEGKKMSKSAHNFYTLPDIIEKGFSPLDFRMLILQSHYRSATNFSWDNLAAAHNRLKNWRNVAELRWQTHDAGVNGAAGNIDRLLNEASDALTNDLSTPSTLKSVDIVATILGTACYLIDHSELNSFIEFVDSSLGLRLAESTPDITDEQKKLIADRETARANKNWAESDKLRDQLAEQGIELNDTANKTIWSRK